MSRDEDREKLPTPCDRRLAREFLDTVDPEAGTDLLTAPRVLADWLVERKLLEPETEVTEADFQRAISFRDGVRAWLDAEGKADRELTAGLGWAMSTALVRFRFTRRANLRLEPAAPGFDGALGRLLALLLMDRSTGLWPGTHENTGAPYPERTSGGFPNLSGRWPSCRWYGLRCGEWITSIDARRRKRWRKRRRADRR